VGVSVASEYDHAEQVVTDVALLQDMAAGRLDGEQVREAAEVLLAHRRHDLPSVSVAVAARLLGVSRTTIESWLQAGVLIRAAVTPKASRSKSQTSSSVSSAACETSPTCRPPRARRDADGGEHSPSGVTG
jgi:hypothetical protein